MEKAIFFPSIGGDRKYNAQDLADTIGGLVTNGVYSRTAINLKADAAGGMYITLQPGLCVINGRVGINKNPVTLMVDAADGVLHRIDRVVLRCDYNEREIREYIKKGTPASSPSAPALQRDADAYEISVANIALNAGTATITQPMITDTRASGDLCGYVDFAANPGLQGLFSEMQAQIDTLLAELDLGNLPASAITSGVFDTARLPGASTSGAGIVRLNSAVDSAVESQAATPLAVKTVNDKAIDLERSRTYIVATNVGGNNFTAADTSVAAYSNGLRRTVFFTAASEAPQININGKGYRPVLQASGVPLKVKAYQMVDIIAENVSFFAVRSGGGIDLPSTIQAGETLLMSAVGVVGSSADYVWQTVWTAGWSFKAVTAGTYRVRFYCQAQNGNNATRLIIDNTTVVSGSEISSGLKTIDVYLAAGQRLYLQVRGYTMSSSGEGRYENVFNFNVSILAAELQVELNKLGYAL